MAKRKRYLMDEDFDEKDIIDDNDIDDYYAQDSPVKRSRKKNNRQAAGIIAAVIIVCVLVAGGIGLVTLIDKYTPNKTRITFEDYYIQHGFAVGNADEQENGAQEAFVLLNGEQTDAKAYCFGDVWYFKKDFIDENLNHRFYLDVANDELIYTTPTKIVTIPFESQAYYVGDKVKKEHYVVARRVDEDIYIAADFIKERADFIYEVRNEPYRMLVTTVYGASEYVHIADEGMVRTGASIKDEILAIGDAGASWSVAGEDGDWTELVTDDDIRGYIRTKELGEKYTVTTSNDYQAPMYTSVSRKDKVNMVWHAVYDMNDNDKIYGLLDATEGVNVVSPTWYQLSDSTGGFNSFAQQEYVDYIHETGRQIWPLWSDFTSVSEENGWSEYELFAVTQNRRALIASMMDEVKAYGYDGINIDFEKVSSDNGIHFVQFLRELSIECRNAGVVLAVDNYVPMPHSAHYDRAEQGAIVDYVIVMGYDEHYGGGSEAGSVA